MKQTIISILVIIALNIIYMAFSETKKNGENEIIIGNQDYQLLKTKSELSLRYAVERDSSSKEIYIVKGDIFNCSFENEYRNIQISVKCLNTKKSLNGSEFEVMSIATNTKEEFERKIINYDQCELYLEIINAK